MVQLSRLIRVIRRCQKRGARNPCTLAAGKWLPGLLQSLSSVRVFARTPERRAGTTARVRLAKRVALFSLFVPEIYSERGVVFGRNPSLRAIRRPRKQQNVRCSAAVFPRFSDERTAKIVKIALSVRTNLSSLAQCPPSPLGVAWALLVQNQRLPGWRELGPTDRNGDFLVQ